MPFYKFFLFRDDPLEGRQKQKVVELLSPGVYPSTSICFLSDYLVGSSQGRQDCSRTQRRYVPVMASLSGMNVMCLLQELAGKSGTRQRCDRDCDWSHL